MLARFQTLFRVKAKNFPSSCVIVELLSYSGHSEHLSMMVMD